MHFLEMMELVMTALEYANAGKRAQVPKSKLQDIYQIASTLLFSVNPKDAPMFAITVQDLIQAIETAEKIEMEVLPDTMKEAIVKALYVLKEEIAALAFKYFTYNEFTFKENDEVFKLMREVVKAHLLGGNAP